MNRKILFATALAAAALHAPQAAAGVDVSIGISQPGVYGRIDIGRFPQPALVLPQPVVVAPIVGVPRPEPLYLWVPMEHRKNWARYCGRYNACGHPVYFVQHGWYDQHVMGHPPRGPHGARPAGYGPGRPGPGPAHGNRPGRPPHGHDRDDHRPGHR